MWKQYMRTETSQRETLKHDMTIRVTAFNVKGMNYITARQEFAYLMKNMIWTLLGIAMLQETHANYTGKESHNGYMFYFASNIADEHRRCATQKFEVLNDQRKRK